MKISKQRIIEIVREELSDLLESENSLTGKEVADKIKNSKDKGHKMFFGKKALSAIAKKANLLQNNLMQCCLIILMVI